jgi:predicted 2-oxoglutarate/Fe(II)-dependent dioxygenase YbiX
MDIEVFENFLSLKECDFILNKCKRDLTLSAAKVYGTDSDKTRKSSVAWISDLGFLNERVISKLRQTFNINGMEVTGLGSFQFTEYKENQYFDWHMDNNSTIYKHRFASVVIQLNDTYTGGILEIKNFKGKSVPIENKIGTLYVFNSGLLHRVTPIVKGTRYSLVNWVSLVKTNKTKQNLI